MSRKKGSKNKEKKFLSPRARLLYFVLVDQAAGSGVVNAPYDELLSLTGYMNKWTIIKALEELSRVQLIEVEYRNNNGADLANRYLILREIGLADFEKLA